MGFRMSLITIFVGTAYSLGAFAGAGSSGGANGIRIEETKISYWLYNDEHLKHAMLNWIAAYTGGSHDVVIKNDPDQSAKKTLARLLINGELQKAIQTPNNFVNKDDCQDISNKNILSGKSSPDNTLPSSQTADYFAATEIGGLNSQICFDTKKLAEAYFKLSDDEAMRRLGAIDVPRKKWTHS